jgi:glycosyltransferase involved in cell wall biosynthesis
MKVLQLCKKYPYPVKDGEALAITRLAWAMWQQGAEVWALVMNTHKHRYEGQAPLDELNCYHHIAAVSVDNRPRLGAALKNLFSGRSYHIERFLSEAYARQLSQILRRESFDVVQLETAFLLPYVPFIREHSRARVVLRAHNVESEIWERIAIHSPPLKRWYLQVQARRLKAYEKNHINDADLLVAISERDRDTFLSWGLHKPAFVVPIGLDPAEYLPDEACFHRPLSLCFIGALDWWPNVEGLRWFLHKVWTPFLASSFPQLSFHIAGRNTPSWLLRLKMPRVHVHGEVPDARAFINAHPVMIVPLLSGGGMRAKIVEAMALGRVVISTSIGLEGIAARHREEVLIADDAPTFAKAVRFSLEQKHDLPNIGRRARAFCVQHFDYMKAAEPLLEAYRHF